MKLKVNDNVVVIAGKYKGKSGKVMRVFKKTGRVTVEGVNIRTRHIKRTAARAGEKIKYEAPFDASNVMLIDPKSNKRTRVGYDVSKGKKVRVAKNSKTQIEDIVTSKKK